MSLEINTIRNMLLNVNTKSLTIIISAFIHKNIRGAIKYTLNHHVIDFKKFFQTDLEINLFISYMPLWTFLITSSSKFIYVLTSVMPIIILVI